MLAVIVCALALALTYPIRAYVAQRANIAALEAKRVAAQKQVDEMEQQRKRWDDPAYVEAQARERLRYVRPGEFSYVVADPPPKPAAVPVVGTGVHAPDAPWYDRLWSSVEVAGTPPKAVPKTAPKPAPKPAPQPARKPAVVKKTTPAETTRPVVTPFQPR